MRFTHHNELTRFSSVVLLMLVGIGMGPGLQQSTESEQEIEYVGILLPKLCAARFPELLSQAAEHSLTCAVFPQCYESGYGIVMEDKFYGFDQKGDDLARRIVVTLKAQQDVQVVVRGVVEAGTLKATAISEKAADRARRGAG
jgi:hypothetical protein